LRTNGVTGHFTDARYLAISVMSSLHAAAVWPSVSLNVPIMMHLLDLTMHEPPLIYECTPWNENE
jgi:hypothetical protein